MSAVKVLHMADMHLEWPFAGMGADERQGRLRREELKATFARIIDLAAQEQVHLLLIAGDLFEHRHVTRGTIQFIDQMFRRIPATRVFISPGNHDPILSASYYRMYNWSGNVHIFSPEASRVDLNAGGVPVSVYGWGFGGWEERRSRLDGLRATDPDRLNLVVLHGGDEAYHPFSPADVAALGADYVALGHIHKGGVLLEERGRVIARYSGSPEALDFGEPGDHGVWVGCISKQANQMRFEPTGLRSYVSADLDVTGAVSVEDLAEVVRSVDSPERRRRHCYRLTLTGAVDPEFKPDVSLLMSMLTEEFYLLRLVDRTAPGFDLETLARERSARGLFVQQMLAAAADAADPTALRIAQRALAAGLTAFAGKGGGR